MRAVTAYIADDGTSFDAREACEAHEAAGFARQFVGLTLEQVDAALARTNVPLADAFEAIGNRISKARLDAGELRRRSNKAGAAPPLPSSGSVAPAARPADDGRKNGPGTQQPGTDAFDQGRQAFRAGKPETIPGGLPEADWDRWAEGYEHEARARVRNTEERAA